MRMRGSDALLIALTAAPEERAVDCGENSESDSDVNGELMLYIRDSPEHSLPAADHVTDARHDVSEQVGKQRVHKLHVV